MAAVFHAAQGPRWPLVFIMSMLTWGQDNNIHALHRCCSEIDYSSLAICAVDRKDAAVHLVLTW